MIDGANYPNLIASKRIPWKEIEVYKRYPRGTRVILRFIISRFSVLVSQVYFNQLKTLESLKMCICPP